MYSPEVSDDVFDGSVVLKRHGHWPHRWTRLRRHHRNHGRLQVSGYASFGRSLLGLVFVGFSDW